MSTEKYASDLESLRNYTTPEWYKDAKFGIYTHWGPYAVPAHTNEWYPNLMYDRDNAAFQHHSDTWGRQKEFGYKDFIPMFTAENWDPEYWADLFKRAGARFAGPVAEHHDGFPMYDCSFTDWNSVKMGPQRDVTAEQKKAFEAVGMKFVVTSHRAHNARHFRFEDDFDTMDPSSKGIYWKPWKNADDPVDEEFMIDWLGRTKELIDKFVPDILWFDFGWHRKEFTPYRLELVAYYYNQAQAWGKEVVMNYKDHLFDGAGVYNIERGKLAGIREEYWQTDTAVGKIAWGYIENEEFKSATRLVHDLVDIVSKNGNVLLSFGPRPDGVIPEEVEGLLLAQGTWLEVNGEAIYGTRHWEKFGEGPTAVDGGHFSEKTDKPFTNKDYRFTVRPGSGKSNQPEALYAIAMGWPGITANVKSLATGCGIKTEKIQRVSMLGIDGDLEWKQDHEGLHVTLPSKRPCEHAYALKLWFRD